VIGLVVAGLGGLLWVAGRFFNVGNLPGDVRIEGQGFSCFVPIASMIVISIILTIVLNIVIRIINRS
jgi:hypothetical protein